MRKLLFKLHLYVALAAGVFVVMLGITGAIMAFEPEIDRVLHWKLSYVTPSGHTLSVAEIRAAVERQFPGERIAAYGLEAAPNLSWSVLLRRGQVFVNPYTGEALGVREGGMDLLGYVHQLHLRLLWRSRSDPGKKIVSWAGVAMLFLLFSGLYLWWPVKRVTIQRGMSPRRFWYDLHSAAGIFSGVFLLALTVTGLIIGFDETTGPLLYKMTGSQPSQMPDPPAGPPPGARPITPDQAIAIARDALPGATPFLIIVPGPKGAYQVRCRYPEDLTPGGRSRVLVDQYRGAILFAEGSRAAPAGTRLVNANRALHTGDIFGIPSKAVMSLASLMAVVQVVSGAMLWWRKSRR